MNVVYVVTYSLRGAEEGQFFEECAYKSIVSARIAAAKCRLKIGEGQSWRTVQSKMEHVVERQDTIGRYLKGRTVWIEKLEVEE